MGFDLQHSVFLDNTDTLATGVHVAQLAEFKPSIQQSKAREACHICMYTCMHKCMAVSPAIYAVPDVPPVLAAAVERGTSCLSPAAGLSSAAENSEHWTEKTGGWGRGEKDTHVHDIGAVFLSHCS